MFPISISSHNLRLFLLFRATTRAILFAPYIQFFMQRTRGLSEVEYGLLQGLYYLVVVLAEVPSGVLADRIGRKTTLILGAACGALGSFVFALSFSFWAFVGGEVLFALATAIVSGADSALLYDSLAADRRESEYARAEGAAQASWLCVTALGLPLADRFLVVDGDPVLAYWVTGGLIAVGGLSALGLREPPLKQRLSTREITSGALRDVVRIPGIARLIVYSVGLFALLRASIVNFFHPALADAGVPVDFYGTVLAVVNVAGAVAAWRAHGWLRRVGQRAALVAMPLSLLYMFLLLTQLKVPGAALLFCIQGVGFGAHPVVVRSILNRLVPRAERRATTLSIESFACRLAYSPLAVVAGWSLGALGVDRAIALTALLAGLPFLLLPLLRRAVRC
ncbi:MAG: MFS transporter [Planctomycetota bacterium]|jgi:MFS family permease